MTFPSGQSIIQPHDTLAAFRKPQPSPFRYGPRRLRRIGFTCGAFDLLHAGHMLMLEECKQYCDYLIVGLQIDPSVDNGRYRDKPKLSPVMSLAERRTLLDGCRYVDEIHTYRDERELYDLLLRLHPDVRILGADWQGKQFTGADLNMEIVFNSRSHSYSTTELKERVFEQMAKVKGLDVRNKK